MDPPNSTSIAYPDPLSLDSLSLSLSRPSPVDASQDLLVRIPSSIAHLVDRQGSVHLASGDFSLVRLSQSGSGLAVLARVGDGLQWPITKDQASVKLDQFHYFFSLAVPQEIEEECRSSPEERGQPTDASPNILNYGITFAPSSDAASLKQLDEVLKRYSFFTAPTLTQAAPGEGVPGEEEHDSQASSVQISSSGPETDGSSVAPERAADSEEFQIQPKEGETVLPADASLEKGSAEYWTLLAPNVEDYSSSIARAIAIGTGHIIRGIFWCSEATIAQLEKGNLFMKGRLKPNETSTKVSPRAMRRIHRVRKISEMSEGVAASILSGVVKAASFVTKPLVTSKAGQKLLTLLPGQIALASLDAFEKIFDAVEVAGKNVLNTTSVVTTGLVSQRYGNEAGEFTQEGLQTAGGFLTTAWSISKLRKVFYPSSLVKSAGKVAGEEYILKRAQDNDEQSS